MKNVRVVEPVSKNVQLIVFEWCNAKMLYSGYADCKIAYPLFYFGSPPIRLDKIRKKADDRSSKFFFFFS